MFSNVNVRGNNCIGVWGYMGGAVSVVCISVDGVFFLSIPKCPSVDIDCGVCWVIELYPFVVVVVVFGGIHEFIDDKAGGFSGDSFCY